MKSNTTPAGNDEVRQLYKRDQAAESDAECREITLELDPIDRKQIESSLRLIDELTCPECPNDDVVVGQKSADGVKVQRWFDCPDCGYEGRSKIVYGNKR